MKSTDTNHPLSISTNSESLFPWNPEEGIAAKRPKRPGRKRPTPPRRMPRRR